MMASNSRRLILKPAGLKDSELARLADALNAVIEQQKRLAAQSPYILRFEGALQQSEHVFFVEHEPAAPLPVTPLFDPAAAPAGDTELLHAAASLFDALRIAHAGEGGRAIVHGGLCPGTLLKDPFGIIKVTDFGFAPAVCAALGVDSYLNLAIGPYANTAVPGPVSGAWEVLPEHEFERDDRLCSFIDPEKYGQNSLTSFEPLSDIIAAGFILHLLAEHHHPYFFAEREAHRIVEMAKMMAWAVPAVARRKELKDSPNKGVQVWCELVREMLARLPKDRPPARGLAERLGPYVQDYLTRARDRDKLQAEEEARQAALAAQVAAEQEAARNWRDQLRRAMETQNWKSASDLLRQVPPLQHAPPDVLEYKAQAEREATARLESMAREIKAQQQQARAWLQSATDAANKKQWQAALDLLTQPPDLQHWPEEVRTKAASLEKICRHEIEEARNIQERKRAAQVRDLARQFVQQLLQERFAGLLESEAVKTGVSDLAWSGQRPSASGHGRLALQIQEPGAAPGPVIGHALHFQIETPAPKICDEDGELQTVLTRDLTRQLTALQKARLDDFRATLQNGLFPEAEFKGGLKEAAPRFTTVVEPLKSDAGENKPENKLEIELRWNPKTFRWEISDEAGFATRAVDLAVVAARKTVAIALRKQSPELERYRKLLTLEVALAAPPSNGLPQQIALEGRLGLRLGPSGEPQFLQAFPFTYPPLDPAAFKAGTDKAEAALRQILLTAQDSGRQALADDLDKRLQAAKVKVKLAAPKKLKEPADTLPFEFKPTTGKGPALTLAAEWKIGSFTYEWPADWEAALNKFFAASVKEDPPETEEQRKQREKREKEEAERRRMEARKRRKRALTVAGVVGPLVAVGGLAAAYFTSTPDLVAGAITAANVDPDSTLTAKFSYQVEGFGKTPDAQFQVFVAPTEAGLSDPQSRRSDARVEPDGTNAVKITVPNIAGETPEVFVGVEIAVADKKADNNRGRPVKATVAPPEPLRMTIGALDLQPAQQGDQNIKGKFDFNVTGRGRAQPFKIKIYASEDERTLFDPKQMRKELDGKISAGAQTETFELPAQNDTERDKTLYVGVVIDKAVGPGGTDIEIKNNRARKSAVLPGKAPVLPPPEALAGNLTVNLVQMDEQSATLNFAYTINSDTRDTVKPFGVKVFVGDKPDENALFDPKNEVPNLTEKGQTGRGDHTQKITIPINNETKRTIYIGAELGSISGTGGTEKDVKNNRSKVVKVELPGRAPVPPEIAVEQFAAGDVKEGEQEVKITLAYGGTKSEQVKDANIEFFWSKDRNGSFDPKDKIPADRIRLEAKSGAREKLATIRVDNTKKETAYLSVKVGATGGPGAHADRNRKTVVVNLPGPKPVVNLVRELSEAFPKLAATPSPQPLAANFFQPLVGNQQAEAVKFITGLPSTTVSIKDPQADQAQNRVSFKVALTLPAQVGESEQTFIMRKTDKGWEADPANAEALGQLQNKIIDAFGKKFDAGDEALKKLVQDTSGSLDAGQLVKGRDNVNKIREALTALNALKPGLGPKNAAAVKTVDDYEKRLDQWSKTLPPAAPPALNGGKNGPQDETLGYPKTWTDAKGQTLLLVNVPPSDPLWKRLGQENQRRWLIFYIDAAEQPGTTDTAADAQKAAQTLGRQLPTKNEWLLAALKLRANPDARNFLGGKDGKFEWCRDNDKTLPENAWACGGGGAELESILPPPAANAPVEDAWNWLNNVLVSMRRSFGDGLTTFRTILPVFEGQLPPAQ